MLKNIVGMFLGLALLCLPSFANQVSGIGVRTVYSSTNVGTTNWVVLSSSLPNTVSSIAVGDTSGQTMEVGICDVNATANSEVRQFLIPAGGITVKVQISPTQRVSIRAVSGNATSGENNFNALF